MPTDTLPGSSSVGSTSTIESSNCEENRPKKSYIEPITFLLFFAYNVSSTVFQDQVVFQVCVSELKYNFSDCVVLGTNNDSAVVKDLEEKVQPYVTDMIMAKSVVEAIVPAILSLFIGPWSDKFGRKPMIVASLFGFSLTYLIITILCAVSDKYIITPWYYVAASIPVALTGGMCTLITGIFCFVVDVTTPKDRPFKMMTVEATLYVGLLLGSFSSSYIYAWQNSTFVFGLSTVFIFISFLYAIFFIDESKEISELEDASFSSKIKELFKSELAKDMFSVCFKRRPNHDRAIIWIIMLSLGFAIFIMEGNGTVFFLFVREKFSWTVKDFTFYSAYNTCSLIIGNIIVMYGIKRIFSVSEIAFVILAFVSCLVDSIISAVAFKTWHLYMGIALTIFKGLVSPMCRSLLASTSEHSNISGNEIGKIYSFTTSLESLLPIGAVFLYPIVYRVTIQTFPGAFNIISAAIYLGIIISMIFVYVFQRRYGTIRYRNME